MQSNPNISVSYWLSPKFVILLYIVLFQSTYALASSKNVVDSLRLLLTTDTISQSKKVDIRKNLIRKLDYVNEDAFQLLHINDSICKAEGFYYRQGFNAFLKTIHYNRKKQYDSIYIKSIQYLDSIAQSINDPQNLNYYTQKAYGNYYYGINDHAQSEWHLRNAIDECIEKDFKRHLPA